METQVKYQTAKKSKSYKQSYAYYVGRFTALLITAKHLGFSREKILWEMEKIVMEYEDNMKRGNYEKRS